MMSDGSDPFDLSRFVIAQAPLYASALGELRRGRKATHWMWFIFPQLRGLGSSPRSMRFGISGREEAVAYLEHPVLGPRLIECADALLAIDGHSAHDIFGSPDDRKLQSCATLFAAVMPAGSPMELLLKQYFDGERDLATLQRLS